MGVKSVLGASPAEVAADLIGSPEEKSRREKAMTRLSLYRDDLRGAILAHSSRVFQTSTIRKRIEPHVEIASAAGFYRRVINEVAGHVYSLPPRRLVYEEVQGEMDPDNPPENKNQENFNALSGGIGLDRIMDQACKLSHAHNDLVVYFRHVPRLKKIVGDTLTPGQCSVVADPDDPSRILALLYQSGMVGKNQRWTYIDDETVLTLVGSHVVSETPNTSGRLDAVSIHTGTVHGGYWDETTGNDLVHAQILCGWLYALIGKLHKSQSWKQQTIFADVGQVAKGQLRDDESTLILPIGSSTQTDDLATSPSHFLETINHTVKQVAANYGISRERLNQETRGVSAEPGLLERRQSAIRVFRDAEHQSFEIIRALSQETEWPISDESRFEIDFAEVEALADRKTQLEIWETMERLGLRNVLDDIAEVSPEFQTDAERMAEYLRNIQLWGWRREKARDLNAPTDADVVGLSPEQNGAAGPVARDRGQDAAKTMLESMRSNERKR